MNDPGPSTSKNSCPPLPRSHDSNDNEEEIELLEEWETTIIYTCKHCPGLEFTAQQRDRHKRWHKLNGKRNKNKDVEIMDETLNVTGIDSDQGTEIVRLDAEDDNKNEFNRRCKRCPGARFTVLGIKYHRKLHYKHLNQRQKKVAEIVTIGESSSSED